jgi:hypothetical protein
VKREILHLVFDAGAEHDAQEQRAFTDGVLAEVLGFGGASETAVENKQCKDNDDGIRAAPFRSCC